MNQQISKWFWRQHETIRSSFWVLNFWHFFGWFGRPARCCPKPRQGGLWVKDTRPKRLVCLKMYIGISLKWPYMAASIWEADASPLDLRYPILVASRRPSLYQCPLRWCNFHFLVGNLGIQRKVRHTWIACVLSVSCTYFMYMTIYIYINNCTYTHNSVIFCTFMFTINTHRTMINNDCQYCILMLYPD